MKTQNMTPTILPLERSGDPFQLEDIQIWEEILQERQGIHFKQMKNDITYNQY